MPRLNFKGNQISILKKIAKAEKAVKVKDLVSECCISALVFQTLTADLYKKKYIYNPRIGYVQITKHGIRYLYALKQTPNHNYHQIIDELDFKVNEDPNYPYPELITGDDD